MDKHREFPKSALLIIDAPPAADDLSSFATAIESLCLHARAHGGWVIWVSTGTHSGSKPRSASFTHANPFSAGIHNLSDYGSIISPFDFIATKPSLNAFQTRENYTMRVHADEAVRRGPAASGADDYETALSRFPDSGGALDLFAKIKSLGAELALVAGLCDEGSVAKTALASALLGIPTIAVSDAMLARASDGLPLALTEAEHRQRCSDAIARERKALALHGEANKLSLYRSERPELFRFATTDELRHAKTSPGASNGSPDT